MGDYYSRGKSRVRLYEAYHAWLEADEPTTGDEVPSPSQLLESGYTTDFPTYLQNITGKRLKNTYNEQKSAWHQYSTPVNVPDFKPVSWSNVKEMENWKKIGEADAARNQSLAEVVGATLSVETFESLFSIHRKAIINDDLGQLRDSPAKLARSAARTISVDVVGRLESNPTLFDSVALFHATHNNLITDALSETGLGNAVLKLNNQTDDSGNPIRLAPELLTIAGGNEITARRILNSTEIHIQGSGTTAAYGQGNLNPMRNAANYIVDRYFTDANDWYLWAAPAEAPVIAIGYLNNNRTPQIMLRDPGMRFIGGGSDPYTMEWDELFYKGRHEWGIAFVDFRGCVKAAVA